MCTHRGDALLKLQKRLVRNLFGKFYSNSNCLFRDARILKLPDIYILKVGIYMFRIMVLSEYPILRSHLELEFPHDHFTRYHNEPRLPLPRVQAIRINFQYQFISIWNCLPDDIKNSDSLRIFKQRLIEHLFQNY